jgi:hypothetical protein
MKTNLVRLVVLLALSALGACGGGEIDTGAGNRTDALGAPGFSHSGGNKVFGVMTRNLYLGADLDPVITALAAGQSPVPAASSAWATVQATDFPTRAIALADEIASASWRRAASRTGSLPRSSTQTWSCRRWIRCAGWLRSITSWISAERTGT